MYPWPHPLAEPVKTGTAAAPSEHLAFLKAFGQVSKYKLDSTRWRMLADTVAQYVAREVQYG